MKTLEEFITENNDEGLSTLAERVTHPFLIIEEMSDKDQDDAMAGTKAIGGGEDDTMIEVEEEDHEMSGSMAALKKSSSDIFVVELKGDKYIVGRGDECEIQMQHKLISREHAILEKDEKGRFHVIDGGSKNGTALNYRVLRPKEKCRLEEADSINIGGAYICMFFSPAALHAFISAFPKE